MTPYEVEVMTKLVELAKCAYAVEHPAITNAVELLKIETLPESDYRATCGMTYFLVIGSNGCWGRGFSVEDALANASKPKHFIAWKANTKRTPIMGCTGMGGLEYRGEEPVEVERKLPKEKKVKV